MSMRQKLGNGIYGPEPQKGLPERENVGNDWAVGGNARVGNAGITWIDKDRVHRLTIGTRCNVRHCSVLASSHPHKKPREGEACLSSHLQIRKLRPHCAALAPSLSFNVPCAKGKARAYRGQSKWHQHVPGLAWAGKVPIVILLFSQKSGHHLLLKGKAFRGPSATILITRHSASTYQTHTICARLF